MFSYQAGASEGVKASSYQAGASEGVKASSNLLGCEHGCAQPGIASLTRFLDQNTVALVR